MKKNTTNTGFLPWENDFSPAEQQALQNSNWSELTDGATPSGRIPDSPTAVAALAADYERLFHASASEDLKKYFVWLLLILAFLGSPPWNSDTSDQYGPNLCDHGLRSIDAYPSPGDTLAEGNPTETPPKAPLAKTPPGTKENKKITLDSPSNNATINMDMPTTELAHNIKLESRIDTGSNAGGVNYGIGGNWSGNRLHTIDSDTLFYYSGHFTNSEVNLSAKYEPIGNNTDTKSDLIRFRIGDVAQSKHRTTNSYRNKDSLFVFLIQSDACANEQTANICYNVTTNQVFKATFKALSKTQGYQFTLNHAGLELMDILPGQSMGLDNFGVFAQAQAVTTSWNGDILPEFALKFRAKQPGRLPDLLSVSSRITKAIAYGYADAQPLDIALRFEGPKTAATNKETLELYQNLPNPFTDKTTIGFNLPEEGKAILTITDKMGRTLLTRENAFAKGYNTFVIDRTALPVATTDVLYYTVQTGAASATKKMDLEIK